ncbi:YlaI family protein [Aquibacillus sediminis]|uniref:YlaI family protein n=1 Tax=Aquibacillus sediminis TaxID=2574734 RepID=UPI00110838B6|nr:YlaI family protein [Aquibacillus sediminis]
MRVKCVLCDTINRIDANSFEAKRLRNRRIHMYLCPSCDHRIGEKTKKRHATGNFNLYREKKNEDYIS